MGWMGVYNLGFVGLRRFHGAPSRLDLLEGVACAGVYLVANPPDAGARRVSDYGYGHRPRPVRSPGRIAVSTPVFSQRPW